MSGHRGGVQVVLKETFPNSHQLNSVLCAAAKSLKQVRIFFDIVDQIHSFFTGAKGDAFQLTGYGAGVLVRYQMEFKIRVNE